MNQICRYTIDEYIDRLTAFHGHLSPGILIGGFMVDAAVKRMSEFEFFDAISESAQCLPDAIQILTPCTIGNGWLKIVNTGRFALTLYDKKSGKGVRVSLDLSRLEAYPEIKKWFLRLVSKRDQDSDALFREIRAAGDTILSIQPVTVSPELRCKGTPPPIAICESCGEAFPENGSPLCLACQSRHLYVEETWTPDS